MEEFEGLTNYPGTVTGTLVTRVESITRYPDPVLYCDNFLIDHVVYADKLKAVLVRRKNFLCHAAIVCREKRIPSAVGVNIPEPKEGARVRLEAGNEKARIVLY